MVHNDHAGATRDGTLPAGHADLAGLLRAWQAEGCEHVLESLIRGVAPIVAHHARRVLRDAAIRDPAAVDDAVALVLDHLRRLPGTADGERSVAKFPAAEDQRRGSPDAVTFLRVLATSRARDVARSRRRVSRRELPFATLHGRPPEHLGVADAHARADEPEPTPRERLLAAIEALDPRERTAVSLRLEGKSLAVVAHALGVCEGTASRIHARAVARLRAALRPR